MNIFQTSLVAVSAAAAGMAMFQTTVLADDAGAPAERVGIYDSRVVAYAQFSSEENQKQLSARIKEAKDAQAGGQTNQLKKLQGELKSLQEQVHLQVFSTAPIDDILAKIQARLPEIQRAAGVSKLVSKWDTEKLKLIPAAKQVDVTDALAREFKPTEKQLKVMADIRKNKPVLLDKMKDEKDF